jgi:hydrogenase/urease accessory protein HupE
MRVVWLLALACCSLQAHTLQITGVTIRIGSDRIGGGATLVRVVAHVPMFGGADPATEIPKRLKIRLDGESFQAGSVTMLRDAAYDTVVWEAREARVPGAVSVAAPIFPEVAQDTTVVLVYRDGQLTDRIALNGSHPSAVVGESVWAVLRHFTEMGIRHILSGPDHILFMLGLILGGGPHVGAEKLRRLLVVVTAFTVAHSLTLSLTALGVTSLPTRLVEPVIALSIVAVGVENLMRRKADFELRAWLAFGFGFFHGFGFAGALAEAGLPKQAVGWSLAAFNGGVELGQGLVVLVAVPLLALPARWNVRAGLVFTRVASAGIACAGVVWFVARVWG